MNADITDASALFIPECVSVQATATVPKDISALELVATATGVRLGQIVPLAKGTHIEICGRGFNERTIKAHREGRFYFIFLQDLEFVQPLGAAEAAACASS